MQHYMMLKRNLIYTGITREKRLVVLATESERSNVFHRGRRCIPFQRFNGLVGQERALAMAVKGKQVERRWSKLKEWLQ